MKVHEYWVYILECCDGSYYVGVTNDLMRRFQEHCDGLDESCYTFKRRPLEMRYYEIYYYIHDAIDREKQLKGWTRAKKEALMQQDIPILKALAKGPLSEEWRTLRLGFGCAQPDRQGLGVTDARWQVDSSRSVASAQPDSPQTFNDDTKARLSGSAALTMTGGHSPESFNDAFNAHLSPSAALTMTGGHSPEPFNDAFNAHLSPSAALTMTGGHSPEPFNDDFNAHLSP
ncbi:MAG: GIY-YIG nuclease family protein [Chitinophagaceae bacterium]|nr:MAG: GIY-YIG nuclease family protein [Chitinophagaceae bacterium]